MKLTSISALLVTGALIVGFAGGRPRVPKPPPMHSEEFKAGHELFTTNKVVGFGGKGCTSCHGNDKPLNRTSLKASKPQLANKIVDCIAHPQRVNGRRFDLDAEEIRQLRAYIIGEYRLNK